MDIWTVLEWVVLIGTAGVALAALALWVAYRREEQRIDQDL